MLSDPLGWVRVASLCLHLTSFVSGYGTTPGDTSRSVNERSSAWPAVVLYNPPSTSRLRLHSTSSDVNSSLGAANQADAFAASTGTSPGGELFLQLDLSGERWVLGVATAGDAAGYVSQYRVEGSADGGATWEALGSASVGSAAESHHFLERAARARLVKLTRVASVGDGTFLAAIVVGRSGLDNLVQQGLAYDIHSYAVKAVNIPESMRYYSSADTTTGASSQLDDAVGYSPGGSMPWITLDLGVVKTVVGIHVQGSPTDDSGWQYYTAQVSADYNTWVDVQTVNASGPQLAVFGALPGDVGKVQYLPVATRARYVLVEATHVHGAAPRVRVGVLVAQGVVEKPCCTAVAANPLFCCLDEEDLLPASLCRTC